MARQEKRHIVFVDDDLGEVDTFRRLYQGGRLQVTCVQAETAEAAVAAVKEALKGATPHIFVLDMYFPFPGKPERAFEDFSKAELRMVGGGLDDIREAVVKLGQQLEAAPAENKSLLRAAHAVVHRSRTLLDDWCQLLNQSREGGIALLSLLDGAYPNTPKVFYSRKATLQDAKEALGAGAVDVIAKPDPSMEVLEAQRIRQLFIEYSYYEPPHYIAKFVLKKFGIKLGWGPTGPVVEGATEFERR